MTYTLKYINSATDVYTKSGLTASEVDLTSNDYQLIQEAENEVELLTGRKFTNGNTCTDFLDGPQKDIIGYAGTNATSINISRYPIQSITTFSKLNTDGTTAKAYDTLTSVQVAAGTFDNDDYWLETMTDPLTGSIVPYGVLRLKTDSFTPGHNNYKVAYTYGYTSVPAPVKALAVCLAAIKQWVAFLGGYYNRLDSYSIPQQSVNKGDFFSRGDKMIALLKEESEMWLDRIGRRPRILMFSSGETR